MVTPTLTINQQWLCKENYIIDGKKIGFKKGNIYKIDAIKFELGKILITFKSEIFDEHLIYFDTEFKQHFELAEKTYTLTETFVKELCKEPNIKEAFVREGIIDEVVEIPLKDILETPNDMELGKLVRKLINK